VPGGHVADVSKDPRLLDSVRRESKRAEIVASFCTGAIVLAESGVLDHGPATTHWSSVEIMRDRYPRIEVLSDRRVVDRGNVVTSAGVSAGIDMALHLVARLHGTETALDSARGMEYDSNPTRNQCSQVPLEARTSVRHTRGPRRHGRTPRRRFIGDNRPPPASQLGGNRNHNP
jgi:transcriptional regulator GlxA family with amidase domain